MPNTLLALSRFILPTALKVDSVIISTLKMRDLRRRGQGHQASNDGHQALMIPGSRAAGPTLELLWSTVSQSQSN